MTNGNPRVKLFLSYMLVFVLFTFLILTACIPAYTYMSDFIRTSEIDECEKILDNGTKRLDFALTTIRQSVLYTLSDTRFRVFKYASAGNIDVTVLPQLSRSLTSVLGFNDYIYDAGLIFSNGIIVSRHANAYGQSTDSYYGKYIECIGMNAVQWYSFIRTEATIRPAQKYYSNRYGNYEGLTYSIPWTDGTYATKSVMFAVLPLDTILPNLADSEVLKSGYISISDADGNVLAQRGETNTSKCYEITSRTSEIGLQIRVGIPENIIGVHLSKINQILYTFIIIAFIFAIITCCIFAFVFSKPLTQLFETARRAKSLSSSEEQTKRIRLPHNRYIYQISNSISSLDEQFVNQQETIDQLRSSLKMQLLDCAFRHEIEDCDQLSYLYPNLPESYRICSIRNLQDEENTFEYSSVIMKNMIQAAQESLPDAIIHVSSAAYLDIILPEANAYDRVESVRQQLIDDIGQEITFALSDVFCGWDQISDAYSQTRFMFASIPSLSLPGILQTSDLTDEKTLMPLTYQDMTSLYTLINAANYNACMLVIEGCAEKLKNKDIEIIRHTYYQLHNLLAQIRLENPVLLKDLLLPAFDAKLGMRPLQDALLQICTRLTGEKEETTMQYARTVLEYVNEHIYDKDLYLQSVAAHFGISAPTLQKLMRIAAQNTFAAYVEEKRLAYAFELLSNQNLTVNSVSNQCGFASVNTFYKAFKRKYGISPQSAVQSDKEG